MAGLASNLANSHDPLSRVLWTAALVTWGLTAGACLFAFKPQAYSLHPDPQKLLTTQWLALDPNSFHLRRLRQVAKSFSKNGPILDNKARALTWAARLATVEIFLLLAALWLSGPKS